MKIIIKEIHADAQYMSDLERYRNEPNIYPKPEKDIKLVQMNLYMYDIINYKIITDGIVEEGVPEILIMTSFGEICMNHTLEIENKLDNFITLVENDYLLNLKELPKSPVKKN